jgi:hypothetical protein
MNLDDLKAKMEEIKQDIEHAVINQSFINAKGIVQTHNSKGKKFQNGLEAREALIRSSKLILKIHEAVKCGLDEELQVKKITGYEIHPNIGKSGPEKDVWGLLKKKKQDVVVLFKKPKKEIIEEGALLGSHDLLGKEATKNSIVIGVRSQLSSIDKNFDTLMERAFAETLNLRLRHPDLIMGEVYMLAVHEYDEQAMKENKVAFKKEHTDVEKFISIFNAMSGRIDIENIYESYKYEKSALVLVDFSKSPIKIYTSLKELKDDGIVGKDFNVNYDLFAPQNFSKNIINVYMQRHHS